MTNNKKWQCYPICFFSRRPIKNNSVTPYVSLMITNKKQFYTHVLFSWPPIKNNSVTPYVLFSWPPIKNNSVTPYVLFSWPPIKNDCFMTDKKQQCFIFMTSDKKQQCYPLYLPLGVTQHGGTGDWTINPSITRQLLYLLS